MTDVGPIIILLVGCLAGIVILAIGAALVVAVILLSSRGRQQAPPPVQVGPAMRQGEASSAGPGGIELVCAACGAGNPPEHEFCDRCGKPL